MPSRTTTARAARGAAAGLALLALAGPAQARPLLADAPYAGVTVATSHVTPADVPDPLGRPAARPIHVSPAEADTTFAVSHPPTAPRVVVVHDTGFDWTDAGVGAATSGAVIVLLGAGLIATTRGRRRSGAAQAAH